MANIWLEDKATWLFDLAHNNLDDDAIVKGFLKHYVLAEPGALMSAKAYRDKKALPLVEKLKEIVKNLTIKCVQLTEQGKKLTAKVGKQREQISRLTDKVMEQSNIINRLREKVSDLGRLERYFGREQIQSVIEQSKALEQAERAKRLKRSFEMSR